MINHFKCHWQNQRHFNLPITVSSGLTSVFRQIFCQFKGQFPIGDNPLSVFLLKVQSVGGNTLSNAVIQHLLSISHWSLPSGGQSEIVFGLVSTKVGLESPLCPSSYSHLHLPLNLHPELHIQLLIIFLWKGRHLFSLEGTSSESYSSFFLYD